MTEKFHFTHAGVEYTIPYAMSVKIGLRTDLLESFAKAETAPHMTYKAIEAIAAISGPETVEAIRDMEPDEHEEFVKNWMQSTPGVPGK